MKLAKPVVRLALDWDARALKKCQDHCPTTLHPLPPHTIHAHACTQNTGAHTDEDTRMQTHTPVGTHDSGGKAQGDVTGRGDHGSAAHQEDRLEIRYDEALAPQAEKSLGRTEKHGLVRPIHTHNNLRDERYEMLLLKSLSKGEIHILVHHP